MANIFGSITLDGNLGDWTAFDRLDYLLGSGLSGYELYGRYTGNAYVFAINSQAQPIGLDTTVWLNTDQNRNTGFKIFGFAGGVEYSVNFDSTVTGIVPVLYQIDASGNTIGSGQILDFAFGNNNSVVEFAIPRTALNLNNSPQKIEILTDINNQVFLPPDYSLYTYNIDPNLPQRTDFTKKVGIVFSDTTAKKFFSETAYTQLFLSMQYQAMQAGVPFNVLTENDLTDLNKIVNYDSLIFPSFSNVPLAKLGAISDTLTTAVYKYGIGIITAGDFLTNDENGNALAGDAYQRMKQLLDVTRTGGDNSATAIGNLQAENITHPVMDGYAANEVIRNYNGISYNTYGDGISNSKNPTILADFVVNGQKNNAVLATETGGRNVHFATAGFLADNNLAWDAIRWSVYGNQPTARLNMSRDKSIFISRNDMDQSQEYLDVNPNGNAPGIYDKLLPIVETWKNNYNFVGSYYINVGNNSSNDQYTDWNISKPYYDQLLALGNEIGTHSYTHPDNTALLTPAQLEFEFNQSQLIIEQQLGINIVGAAIPGNPEPPSVANQLRNYLSYVSGGYASVGAGYPGAFGFMFPGDNQFVYFAPNMSFDFSLIQFRQLTSEQAEQVWTDEYNGITNHAASAIIHWPWHDYGPTIWPTDPPNPAPPYTLGMFTNLIARAYNDDTEFVTVAELSERIRSFEKTQLSLQNNGNIITANVVGTDLGTFALNLDPGQQIQSVNNWYAYDNDSVYLAQNGGTFTINLGSTMADVTHITSLPMRAELLSLTGNGTNLDFSFLGQGTVIIDLKALNPAKFSFQGADSTILNGEILQMNFNTLGQHNGRINFIDAPPTVLNPIANVTVNEDAAATTINLSNVFTDSDDNPSTIIKTVFANTNNSLVNASINGNLLTLNYLPNQFGTAQITVRGTSNGLTVDDTFTVAVNSVDDAPIVVNPIADVSVTENAAATTINLSNVFTDIDNDPTAIIKTVFANTNNTLVNASINGNLLTLNYFPSQFGTAQITIRGTSNGLTVDDTFFVNVGNVDNAPTVINPIADVTVNEDAAATTINLSNVFTDIDNDPTAIIKTVFANTNSSLVNASINDNFLTLNYLPNQFGTAQITVRGTSNGLTVDDTFTVAVNSVDDAPIVVNPIADVRVPENAAATMINLSNVFTDIDNDPTAIIKTVFANTNNTLVNASINGNLLTLNYLSSQIGTAQITVRGTSNGLTVDNTFFVNVGNVDNAPTVINPIADVTVNEDAAATTINLSNVFTDIDNDPTAIIKTVVTNTNNSLVNASINGNLLTLNYLPNKSGTAQITVRGTSNGLTVDDTFTVAVNPVDDAPTVINPIVDVTVNEDSAATTINLSNVFTDIDNDVTAITKTIVANSNNTLVNASIAGNVLTLNYLANQIGTAQITVRGTSNGLNVEDTFTVTVNPTGNIINGNNRNNTLTGTDQRDVIYALAGNDTINAKKGDDVVYGGDGDDTIQANDGDDILFGEGGNDWLEGENHNDTLYGGEGDDTLLGGKNDDLLYGDGGNDSLVGGEDYDTLYGGVGNDILDGEGQDDVLYGEAGNDSLMGGNNDDTIVGGTGNDTLHGENDYDTLIGVDPNATNPGIGEIDNFTGGDKGDRFILGDTNRIYYNDSNNGTSGVNDYALITDFDSSQGDVIQLYGSASLYTIANAPTGLPKGSAIYYKTSGQNELIAIVQGTTPLILSSTQFTYGTYNPQTLTNTINGTNGDDKIDGTSEKEIINGLAGDDTIDGKEGDDVIYGNNGYDNLKGGKGNDILYGGDLDDTLDGQDDNDTLYGGGADDDLKGGKGNDVLYGEAGNDYFQGQDGDDTLYGGVGNDDIEGNNQNDQLFGNEGNDTLYGGDGDDTLTGGTGNDIVQGDKGADVLTGVDPNSVQAGLGEIDELIGGDQNDRFILGDSQKAYYNDGNNASSGLGDYALISDFFSSEGDVIQLYGNSSMYSIGNAPNSLPAGKALFLKTSGQNELIAIIQGDTALNLNSTAFSFG